MQHTLLSSHEKDFDIGSGGGATPVQITGARQYERGFRAEHVAHILILAGSPLLGEGEGAQNPPSEALAVYNRRTAVIKSTGMNCIRVLCVRVLFHLVNVVHKSEL